MTDDVNEIRKNIEHCTGAGELYKMKYWINKLRVAVGDEMSETMILNANATPSVYE